MKNRQDNIVSGVTITHGDDARRCAPVPCRRAGSVPALPPLCELETRPGSWTGILFNTVRILLEQRRIYPLRHSRSNRDLVDPILYIVGLSILLDYYFQTLAIFDFSINNTID